MEEKNEFKTQFTARQEVKKKQLEVGKFYAITYHLTDKRVESGDVAKRQWGLGRYAGNMTIDTKYNVYDLNNWNSSELHIPSKSNSMRFFELTQMERDFINTHQECIEARCHVDFVNRQFKEFVNHPIIKFAVAIKKFFS